MKRFLLIVFTITAALHSQAQNYAPITLSGFNEDVVANGGGPALTSTTNDVDGVQFTFMALNFVNPSSQSPTSALPNSGTINSVITPGLTFQLAPYTGANALRISGTGNGTLTFSTPRAADQVYVLATSGSGTSATTITVNFTDATSQTFTQTIGDWYNGTGFAIQGISRVNRTNNVIENSATNPRLYQYLLNFSAANAGKTVQNITFTKTSTGGVLNVMGITIRPVASGLAHDLGITAIPTPNSGCSLSTQETITVNLTNFGSAPQNNIPVSYTLNSNPAIMEVYAGPLAANSSVNFSFSAKANLNAVGNYTITATASGDTNPANDSFTKTITVTAVPATPAITVNGPTTICPGDFSLLTASSTTPGVTYQWRQNTNNINGATSATYAATAGGNYTVVANGGGCSSAVSAAVLITENPAPSVPFISPNGTVIACSGTPEILTASTITPGATFLWLRNGTSIPGATGATYTASQAGNYSVMAASGGCLSSASQATTVTIQAKPAKPVISRNGMVLTSSSGVGNEWFLNGNSIPGAYNKTYTATANGTYKVITSINNCYSDTSAAMVILNTGTGSNISKLQATIYPNPGNGLFHVVLPEGNVYGLKVINLTGKVIIAQNLETTASDLDLTKQPKGIYLLQLTSDKNTVVQKLLIE